MGAWPGRGTGFVPGSKHGVESALVLIAGRAGIEGGGGSDQSTNSEELDFLTAARRGGICEGEVAALAGISIGEFVLD